MPATRTTSNLSEEQIDHVLSSVAGALGQLPRSPVLRDPSGQGLPFEEVSFPSADGVPLEGWFIPAPGSDRLVIANHPMYFTRSGMPTHLEPWSAMWAPSGNDIEVDLIPDYRILHEAGYNVLTYDLRNHGLSGAANGGIASSGLFEARDVLGSLRYARAREDTRDMATALFSRCLGFNATICAMSKDPEAFDGVRCLVGPQPVTEKVILGGVLAVAGVPGHRIDDLEQRIRLSTGIGFEPRDPRPWARSVRVPTFVYQVRDDVLTTPSDVQAIFDSMPTSDKQLHWIEGSTARWDGYLEFQRRPEPMLAWLEAHMPH